MGEVYRARDTRLERTVAIKIIPEHLASHPDPEAWRSDGKELFYLSGQSDVHAVWT